MKRFFFATSILCLNMAVTAQTSESEITTNQKNPCGTEIPDQKWDEWFNEQVEIFKQQQSQNKTKQNYTIPVVVHVLHAGEAVGIYPNITQTQINSQIPILNQDFWGNGYNVNKVPAVYAKLVAATGIQFCLAKKNPQGTTLTEPGIDRVNLTTKKLPNPKYRTTSTTFRACMDSIKMSTIWDPTKYMNIWVSDKSTSVDIYGYATFPTGTSLNGMTGGTGSATKDGVWCYAKAFGSAGYTVFPNNKGRVATHEVGHWLGLRHISGDTTCANDYCNDTPPQTGGYGGCRGSLNWGTPPAGWQGQGGLCSANTTGQEMFMNFMDYTEDAAKYMFTPDQATRMQTAMSQGTYRKLLGTHGLCTVTFGINEKEDLESNITLYPVPTNGTVHVSFNLPAASDLSYTLINTLGQEIIKKSEKNIQNNTLELDLSNYDKGLYFLQISNGKAVVCKKIILDY